MKRVQTEKRSDQETSPTCAGHQYKDQEKQQCIRRVKQNAGQVMSPGFQAKQLAIQHMGQPGQRMPVAYFIIAESPAQALRSETALDMNVGGHIKAVIVVNELVSNRRQVGRQNQEHKKTSEAPSTNIQAPEKPQIP